MDNFTDKDMNQNMKQVLLQTPLRKNILTNTPCSRIFGMVVEDISKMHGSNNYQEITVHYGVKEKNQYDLKQKKDQETLHFKIQQQYQEINRLQNAKSEEQVLAIQKDYQTKRKKLDQRKLQFKDEQFIPHIFIEAKPKKALYGKIFQQFDKKGAALLKATIGYRSPFFRYFQIDPTQYPPFFYDKLEFMMQTPPIQYFRKRQYYQFELSWMASLQSNIEKQLYVNTQASCSSLFKGIDEKNYGISVGVASEQKKVQLQVAKRSPRIYEKISQQIINGQHIPSRKVSVKYDKVLYDSIRKGQIFTGQYKQTKTQCTIPYFSQANFFKFQMNYRKYFDIYSVSKHFQNAKIRNFLQNSNVECNMNLKTLLSGSKKISDALENIEVRGFENDRRPSKDLLQGKFSLKMNNYNYPLLGDVGIIPFLYTQAGFSLQSNLKNPYILGSGGLGISYALNKTVSLELLYSLCQAQNMRRRQPVSFQIRIGIMD